MSGGLTTNGQLRNGQSPERWMSDAPRTAAFTVIEALIVLAITGLLFASTAMLLAGKQSQTAFDQAIRQTQSQIQQVINEVAIGYYPNIGTIDCTSGGSGPNIVSAAGKAQGENTGCIFLGKALQFGITGTDPEEFRVHTIAGLQQDASGAEVSSLLDAKPKAVAPSAAEPSVPNADTTGVLEQGLTTYRMWYNNGAGNQKIGEVAFTNSLAPAAGSSVISGSQQVVVVPIDDSGVKSALGKSPTDGVDAINSNLASSLTDPSGGVFICFASGGTEQSGLITIGNNGRQLSVKLDIKSNKTCDNMGV